MAPRLIWQSVQHALDRRHSTERAIRRIRQAARQAEQRLRGRGDVVYREELDRWAQRLLDEMEQRLLMGENRGHVTGVTPVTPPVPATHSARDGGDSEAAARVSGVALVRAHLKAHPEDAALSTRALGEKLGVSHMTVSRARKR